MNQREEEIATWCGICLENIPLSSHFHSSCGCTETSCRSCLKKWIETEEKTGVSVPSCPFCRASLQKDIGKVADLLGRNFQPRQCNYSNSASNSTYTTGNADDLTQQYLEAFTRSCPACGFRISKTEDTCDLMECLCGYRFCYACGAAGAVCSCDGPNHVFERNMNYRFIRANGNPGRFTAFEARGQNRERSIYHILRRQKERREELERIEIILLKAKDGIERRILIRKKEAIKLDMTRDEDKMATLAAMSCPESKWKRVAPDL